MFKKVLIASGAVISLLVMLALGLPTIAPKLGVNPVYEDAQEYSLANKRALLITTSEAVLEGREETSGSPQTSAF